MMKKKLKEICSAQTTVKPAYFEVIWIEKELRIIRNSNYQNLFFAYHNNMQNPVMKTRARLKATEIDFSDNTKHDMVDRG